MATVWENEINLTAQIFTNTGTETKIEGITKGILKVHSLKFYAI